MKTKAGADAATLKLHIRVVKPVAGCAYAMQRGKTDIEQTVTAGDADIEFTLDVSPHTAADGSADIRGPNVQGPRGARFVYINTGARAHQTDSCWTRRAKIPLQGAIDILAGSTASDSTVLEASIQGRARDGGPACASVPLLGAGWSQRS
jgi:hypothetical protein